MAGKGGSRHMKKLAAPKTWKIKRKGEVWISKPAPGKHLLAESIPMLTVIRNLLCLADTKREVGKIIKEKEVLVDGKVVSDFKYGVGLMDVISIPRLGENYRVICDRMGRIELQKIDAEEAKFKLCKVIGKTVIRGSKIQLNLHDGRNELVEKDEHAIGDVVKISLPDQKILDHYRFKKGSIAYVVKGKHAGQVSKISKINPGTATRKELIELEKNGVKFSTVKDYVLVIGEKKPEIKIGE